MAGEGIKIFFKTGNGIRYLTNFAFVNNNINRE